MSDMPAPAASAASASKRASVRKPRKSRSSRPSKPSAKATPLRTPQEVRAEFKRRRCPQDIADNDIKRLGTAAGVRGYDRALFPKMRDILTNWVDERVRNAVVYMQASNRKTLSLNDLNTALEAEGQAVYGADFAPKPVSEKKSEKSEKSDKPAAKAAKAAAKKKTPSKKPAKPATKKATKAAKTGKAGKAGKASVASEFEDGPVPPGLEAAGANIDDDDDDDDDDAVSVSSASNTSMSIGDGVMNALADLCDLDLTEQRGAGDEAALINSIGDKLEEIVNFMDAGKLGEEYIQPAIVDIGDTGDKATAESLSREIAKRGTLTLKKFEDLSAEPQAGRLSFVVFASEQWLKPVKNVRQLMLAYQKPWTTLQVKTGGKAARPVGILQVYVRIDDSLELVPPEVAAKKAGDSKDVSVLGLLMMEATEAEVQAEMEPVADAPEVAENVDTVME